MASTLLMLRSILTILLFAQSINSSKTKRDVTMNIHRCEVVECGKEYEILHVRATEVGKNDTVHYLWTTISLPSIVVAHNNDPKTNLKIDWKNGSTADMEIKFVPEVSGISALVFKDISEYDDVNDNQIPLGAMKNILQNVTWEMMSGGNLSDGAGAYFKGSLNSSESAVIGIDLKAFTKDGHDTDLPKQAVSAQSVRFSMTLQDLPITFAQSRFSVGLAFIKIPGNGAPSYETVTTIDDEYSPGTFKLRNLKIPTEGNGQGFASWKPVAFTTLKRGFSSQTFLHNFPKKSPGSLIKSKDAIGYSIIDSLLKKKSVYTARLSFGEVKDGFYRKTPFVSWSGLVGYGVAPKTEISTKVWLVIFIGLGVPLAISLFGSLGVVIMKLKSRKKAAYQRIN